jgi:hypothetical protein
MVAFCLPTEFSTIPVIKSDPLLQIIPSHCYFWNHCCFHGQNKVTERTHNLHYCSELNGATTLGLFDDAVSPSEVRLDWKVTMNGE